MVRTGEGKERNEFEERNLWKFTNGIRLIESPLLRDCGWFQALCLLLLLSPVSSNRCLPSICPHRICTTVPIELRCLFRPNIRLVLLLLFLLSLFPFNWIVDWSVCLYNPVNWVWWSALNDQQCSLTNLSVTVYQRVAKQGLQKSILIIIILTPGWVDLSHPYSLVVDPSRDGLLWLICGGERERGSGKFPRGQ